MQHFLLSILAFFCVLCKLYNPLSEVGLYYKSAEVVEGVRSRSLSVITNLLILGAQIGRWSVVSVAQMAWAAA